MKHYKRRYSVDLTTVEILSSWEAELKRKVVDQEKDEEEVEILSSWEAELKPEFAEVEDVSSGR